MHKIVVYTAIFGGKDSLIEPTNKPDGVDFVCLTDGELYSDTWEIRKVSPIHEDPVRAAKIYKILPHRYFPEYEYSVWVDGNIRVREDAGELVDRYLGEKHIAFFDHTQTRGDIRGSVYEEADALLKMHEMGKAKDDPGLIRAQIEKYRGERYPDDNGLIVGMEIVRRHNEPDVMRAMEDWWSEIEQHSRRDQLSFNYVAWKNGLDFAYMDGDARNNRWFLWEPHVN